MSNYFNSDDIECIFADIEIPKVNLTNDIMLKLKNGNRRENSRVKINKLTTSVLGVLVVLLLGVSVNAKQIGSIIDKINTFKPGTVTKMESNNELSGEKEIIHFSKPIVVKEMEVLRCLVSEDLVLIGNLPQGFQFAEADVHYSGNTNKKGADKESSVEAYSIIYKYGNDKIRLNAAIGENPILYHCYTYDEETKTYSDVENVMVNGQKGLLRTYSFGKKHYVFDDGIAATADLGGYKELIWTVKNKFLLSVTFSKDIKLDKSEMISIAESIKSN